jgi:hypothetical protein
MISFILECMFTLRHRVQIQIQNSYLCTHCLYGPVHKIFDVFESITRANEGVLAWALESRLFWAREMA